MYLFVSLDFLCIYVYILFLLLKNPFDDFSGEPVR